MWALVKHTIGPISSSETGSLKKTTSPAFGGAFSFRAGLVTQGGAEGDVGFGPGTYLHTIRYVHSGGAGWGIPLVEMADALWFHWRIFHAEI